MNGPGMSGPAMNGPGGSGTYLGMPAFPKAAHEAVKNVTLRANLRHATHTIRDKRPARSPNSTTGTPCARRAARSRITRSAIWTTTSSSWRSR